MHFHFAGCQSLCFGGNQCEEGGSQTHHAGVFIQCACYRYRFRPYPVSNGRPLRITIASPEPTLVGGPLAKFRSKSAIEMRLVSKLHNARQLWLVNPHNKGMESVSTAGVWRGFLQASYCNSLIVEYGKQSTDALIC